MNNLKRKLNSNAGVTILIALVGFMVAAMVSIVIVTAAVTSAERVANDRTTNQAHLTMESAARLVETEMESVGYTRTEYSNISDAYKTKDSDYAVTLAKTYKKTDDSPDPFGDLILEAMKAAEGVSASGGSGSVGNSSGKFTLSMPDQDDVEDVEVEFEIQNAASGTGSDPCYYLMFTLKGNDSHNVTYLQMQLEQKNTQTQEVGEWKDTEDGDGNVTGQTYVSYYTKKTTTYGWNLISIHAVDSTSTT